jgi:hypothetical protein
MVCLNRSIGGQNFP